MSGTIATDADGVAGNTIPIDGSLVIPPPGTLLGNAGPGVDTKAPNDPHDGPNTSVRVTPVALVLTVINVPVATTETGTSILGQVWPDQGAAEVYPWATTAVVMPC
jgi:hypothetical protein